MTNLSDARFHSLIEVVRESRERQAASVASLWVWQSEHILLNWSEGTGAGPRGDSPITIGSRFNVYSIRKAYYGLAAALMIYEYVLPPIDTPVRPYVTSQRFSGISSELTFRHLFTHTHGLVESADPEGNVSQRFRPGTEWHYNNAGVDLLCHVIETVTGQTVAKIIGDRVLNPLGYNETGWETSAADALVRDVHVPGKQPCLQLGSNTGADRNLFVSGRDLINFAVLHLRGGCFQGRQIIPAEVINMVTTCQTPPELGDYLPKQGFFWWVNPVSSPRSPRCEIGERVPRGAYQIIGMNGCLCLVIPALDAVVVRLMNKIGEVPGYDRFQEYHRLGNTAMECLGH